MIQLVLNVIQVTTRTLVHALLAHTLVLIAAFVRMEQSVLVALQDGLGLIAQFAILDIMEQTAISVYLVIIHQMVLAFLVLLSVQTVTNVQMVLFARSVRLDIQTQLAFNVLLVTTRLL